MEKVSQTDRARFQEIMGNADEFMGIEALVALCDTEGYWTSQFMEQATANAKKSHIRRLIKTIKDEDDFPVWASIETTDEEGNTVRAYKQETLFDVEDYRKVVTYHSDRSNYHAAMAKEYAKRCKRRFHKQLPLELN